MRIEDKEGLRKFRTQVVGFTQEAMANALGIKRSSYGNLETGADKITDEMWVKIGDYAAKYYTDKRKAEESQKKNAMDKALSDADKKNAANRAKTMKMHLANYQEALVGLKEAKKLVDLAVKDADLDGISKKEMDTCLILQGMDRLVQLTLFEAVENAK